MDPIKIQNSPGYAIACEQIRNNVNAMKINRSRPRSFSLHGIRKIMKAPQTAEGITFTRDVTMIVLDELVKEGIIESFRIEPNFTGGPEWAFIDIPKKPKKSRIGSAAANIE